MTLSATRTDKLIESTGKMLFLSVLLFLVSSCASLSPSGVGRVKEYTVAGEDIPPAFDGYRIAFVSDLHYPSLFSSKRLSKMVSSLNEINPDVLFLGGDYVTDNDSIDVLFSSLSAVQPVDGIYAVLGNHERRNSSLISSSMQHNGIVLLYDDVLELCHGGDTVFVVGVGDSFVVDTLAPGPDARFATESFVVMLAHTPDYAERTQTTADLVLSGHTHGGQVSLLGFYTPVKNTMYGTRFLRGRNTASSGATVITTNGVGTSRKKVRFWVPSEIVVITLKCAQQ